MDPCCACALCRCPMFSLATSLAFYVAEAYARMEVRRCNCLVNIVFDPRAGGRGRHCDTLSIPLPNAMHRLCDRGHFTSLHSCARAISKAAPAFACEFLHSRRDLSPSQRRYPVAISAGISSLANHKACCTSTARTYLAPQRQLQMAFWRRTGAQHLATMVLDV